MNVTLLHCSDVEMIIDAMRMCWRTEGNKDTVDNTIGVNDKKLIKHIIKNGHTSTLEHSLFTYKIEGVSRALLQELARHRVGVSLSVESTRYTLKKLLNGDDIIDNCLVRSGDLDIDLLNIEHMRKLKELINRKKLKNDVSKYGLIEAYKVNTIHSFNLRSLRHFYQLRTSPKALQEIQNLAHALVDGLPEEYKFLFEDL